MMRRRTFLSGSAAAVACLAAQDFPIARAASSGSALLGASRQISPLVNGYVTVWSSPKPDQIYSASPGLVALSDGTLLATYDQTGKGVQSLPDLRRDSWPWTGTISTSGDGGKSWIVRSAMPMHHARPFVAGNSVYVLGQVGDILIMGSRDGGKTWSQPVRLTTDGIWSGAPTNVVENQGRIHLVMEHQATKSQAGEWPVARLAPVVLSAAVTDDLLDPGSWSFSNKLTFSDALGEAGSAGIIGSPFFKPGLTAPRNEGDRRMMEPPGWLEANIVKIEDRNHVWYDPSGLTLHLLLRAHTGSTNLACVLKAVTSPGSSRVKVELERAPSETPMLYLPLPGGHLKFHLIYDKVTELYWLASNQSTDSMTRPNMLPPERYNLPNNERNRLVLHFSKNCVDWCFAGVISEGSGARQTRNYPSIAIRGEDLCVLARSGDDRSVSAHNSNLITFHSISRFRELVY